MAKYFLQRTLLRQFKDELKKAKSVFIFLDYDGTITPIVLDPYKAFLAEDTKILLKNISRKYFLSIVSGRALTDLRKRVGIYRILYVSNHGLRISHSNLKWDYPLTKAQKNNLLKCFKEIKSSLNSVVGIKFEKKEVSFAVHYRTVQNNQIQKLKKIILNILLKYYKSLKLLKGKKMFEIKPDVEWNKGMAILKILSIINKGFNNIIIYIGDDITDEYAFKLLSHKAYTIRVGKSKNTYAKYFLRSTKEVIYLLREINENIK